MVMFSKFVSREYTKFLFCLTVLLSLTCECSAEKVQNETKKIVSEELEKTASGIKKNAEKLILKKQGIMSKKKTEDVSKNVATENIASKQPKSQNSKEDTSKNKDVISEFIESISNAKISNMKKPFKDLPGYWKELSDFDVPITNAEANDEFPSEKFSLKSLKGNVVILFFTTTWCSNCIKVFQDLDSLSRALLKKNISNVKIIPLVFGMENDETIKNYYKEHKIKSLRRFKALSPLFFKDIRSVPTCFVYNKKSVPVWGFSGVANYGAFEFLNFIEGLSKED